VTTNLRIEHDPARGRFWVDVDGRRNVCDYRREGHTMVMTHTEVDPDLQGRGIAAALVTAAFDHARVNGLKVRPLCSYVRAWLRRNPEAGRGIVDA
jgi:predicted GNAT family acetyltransferase